MPEEGAKAMTCALFQESQRPLNQVLRGWDVGSGQRSGVMRLDARMSRSEGAVFFRFSAAHRATDRQYMSLRDLPSFHIHHYSTGLG
jgi:hypothetical protein